MPRGLPIPLPQITKIDRRCNQIFKQEKRAWMDESRWYCKGKIAKTLRRKGEFRRRGRGEPISIPLVKGEVATYLYRRKREIAKI